MIVVCARESPRSAIISARSRAELVSQIPAHAEHDDLLVKVSALEESVHFRVRSSALSFDRFANDYAVSKQFAPEPCKRGAEGLACRGPHHFGAYVDQQRFREGDFCAVRYTVYFFHEV